MQRKDNEKHRERQSSKRCNIPAPLVDHISDILAIVKNEKSKIKEVLAMLKANKTSTNT